MLALHGAAFNRRGCGLWRAPPPALQHDLYSASAVWMAGIGPSALCPQHRRALQPQPGSSAHGPRTCCAAQPGGAPDGQPARRRKVVPREDQELVYGSSAAVSRQVPADAVPKCAATAQARGPRITSSWSTSWAADMDARSTQDAQDVQHSRATIPERTTRQRAASTAAAAGEAVAAAGGDMRAALHAMVRMAPGLRQRLIMPRSTSGLPRSPSIVIVEGLADKAAVQRAACVMVYVCGGDALLGGGEERQQELCALSCWPGGLIVLTDPDRGGRDLRMYLDNTLVQLLAKRQGGQPTGEAQAGTSVRHAFVRADEARSVEDSKWHEAGNVGVENAPPDAILAALKAARPSFPATRCEFSTKELQQLGLLNTFNANQEQRAGAAHRRERLCAALGVDGCSTGSSLVTQLNRFFTRKQFNQALAAVNRQQATES